MAQFEGLYFNGKTSAGLPVAVELLATEIQLESLNTEEPFNRSWDINLIARNDFNDTELVELQYAVTPPEYLEVKNPDFLEALRQKYPKATFSRSRYGSLITGNPIPVLSLLAFFILIVAGVYFWIIPKSAEIIAENLPEKAEYQLGQTLIEGLLQNEDKESLKTIYAQRFFNLLQNKKANKVTVTVVKHDQANAFAVPGGNIIVYEPIIQLTGSYEEFAGLLAHENAHLQHRHSLKALFRNLSSYFLVSLLFGDMNGIMVVVAENANSLKSLQYNRDLEKEADMTGLDLLEKRKINPAGMVNLFSALKKQKGNLNLPEFLSTHPVLDSRIAYLKGEIAAREFQVTRHDSLQYYWKKLKTKSY